MAWTTVHGGAGASWSGAPAPPPVPALFSRRGWLLLIAATFLLLAMLVGGGIVLTTRAASSSSDAAAKRLATMKAMYEAAAQTLTSEAATFHVLVDKAAQHNDVDSISLASDSLGAVMRSFDRTVSGLDLPLSWHADETAVVEQDATLLGDLDSPPLTPDQITQWIGAVAADYATASAAHDKLNADFGVNPASFSGAAGNSA